MNACKNDHNEFYSAEGVCLLRPSSLSEDESTAKPLELYDLSRLHQTSSSRQATRTRRLIT